MATDRYAHSGSPSALVRFSRISWPYPSHTDIGALHCSRRSWRRTGRRQPGVRRALARSASASGVLEYMT
jgi:hypothetical protein